MNDKRNKKRCENNKKESNLLINIRTFKNCLKKIKKKKKRMTKSFTKNEKILIKLFLKVC